LKLANEWFYQKDGQEIGPLSPADLRRLASSGQLLPTDPVRKADMDRWAKASALKGLFPAVGAEPAVTAAAAPTSQSPAAAPPPVPRPRPTAQAQTSPTVISAATPSAKAPPPKPPVLKKAAPIAAAPAAIPEDEPEEPAEPTPVKKSKPRWIWYAVAAIVLLGGAGGAYFYIQYQATQNMSMGPGLSPPMRSSGPTSMPAPTNRILSEIVSEKPSARAAGFRQVLAHADIPDEDREPIHKAACDTLADKKQSVAWTGALKVLGRIGTPDDLKRVTPFTTGGGMETRCAALAAAMLISPDDGVKLFEPHASDMAYNGVMNDVVKAGPRCEAVLLALLKSDQRICRYQALGLLTSHGTEKAVDPIKQAKTGETDASLMPAYQAAIDGINARAAKH
jgi:hypothetical protein